MISRVVRFLRRLSVFAAMWAGHLQHPARHQRMSRDMHGRRSLLARALRPEFDRSYRTHMAVATSASAYNRPDDNGGSPARIAA